MVFLAYSGNHKRNVPISGFLEQAIEDCSAETMAPPRAFQNINLRWYSADDGSLDQNGVTHRLTQTGDILTVTLGPDEMLILESE